MTITAEERKLRQRVYQARYQKTAKGKLTAKRKMGPGQPWRLRFNERLEETREVAEVAGRERAAWTDEEVTILRDMRAKGDTYREIALTLFRSQQSVQRKADKLGVPERRAKTKAAKPLVVLGQEIGQIQIDELHKFMRRKVEFSAVKLREHFAAKFPETLDMDAAFRMIDNLLRRDRRAGLVKCEGRRDCSALWHWLG